MSPGAVDAAWYRFVPTWRRQRGGYLTLVLLIGLVGGIARVYSRGPAHGVVVFHVSCWNQSVRSHHRPSGRPTRILATPDRPNTAPAARETGRELRCTQRVAHQVGTD